MLPGDESICVFEKRTRVSLMPMLIAMQCNAPALATVPGDLIEESARIRLWARLVSGPKILGVISGVIRGCRM
jgi:hypothetical protein